MPHVETFINGTWYPSVSTIIGAMPKPWLEAWKDKWGLLADRKTRIANAIGTEFHRCVESWINHGKYTILPPVADSVSMPSTMHRIDGMMQSFLAWERSVVGIIHDTERKVISLKHAYSGTLDAVGTIDERLMLLDWKTSSRIYDDMAMQLSAYANAYHEETGLLIKNGMIVCVSKDKPHHRLTIKEFRLGKRVFNKFLKLRRMFDDINRRPGGSDEKTGVTEATGT